MTIPPGLRLAFGLLSVLPVRFEPAERRTAGAAMVWAPAVGAAIGLAQALVWSVLCWGGAGGLVAAALAVGAGAVLTRALHLDGLADVADGLGSGRPADEALAVMRRSDIGPFGVVALVLTLLLQVAALASAREPVLALVVAAATGRLAVTWACTAGIPAARADGLGALVAGTVPARTAATLSAGLVTAAALAAFVAAGDAESVLVVALAAASGLLVADAFRRHAVRRLGGVTGDVLGALAEAALTTALIVATLG